jgi:DNA repair protein RadA/Sms
VEHLVLRSDAKHRGVDLVILDSIQGGGISAGADTAACRAALDMAQRLQGAGIATLLVGHVTKQNLIRGPRSLEHAVDTVMLLDRRGGRRALTVPKNRFGPAMLRPLSLVLDPATTRIMPAPHVTAHVATVRAYLPGTGLAELQGAASLPPGGGRGRLGACRGIAPDEAMHVLRCLGRARGFEAVVPELDFAVACRSGDEHIGGARQQQRLRSSSLHLPLGVAIAGACLGRVISDDLVAVGEVDLGGRVYPGSRTCLSELTAALRAGEFRGTRLVCPSSDTKFLPWNCGCELAGVDTLEGAIRRVWTDLPVQLDAWSF